MEEEERGIEAVLHNMGFVWEGLSPLYSSSHGHYEHSEMLFLTIPQKIMSVVLKGWNLPPQSHAVCSTQHSGVPYTCFTWWVPVLRAQSWHNPYTTVFLNHSKVLSKKDIHFLLQLNTSPPKSWP